jgi:superfamily II helicase
MSAITDYGLDTPARALLVLMLSIDDSRGKKQSDILHIQKIVRYFEYLRQKREIDYSNFKLGQVSYELDESLQTLQESGLITNEGRNFQLTEEGRLAADELSRVYSADDLRKLLFAKQQLNDLGSDEVLFFMYKLIPESQVNSTEANRLFSRSKEFVKTLYLKGKVSSAIAAKWLNVSESDFLNSLKK